jgi:hypothetical protein
MCGVIFFFYGGNMLYKILKADTSEELEVMVSEAIEDGKHDIVGGVAFLIEATGRMVWAQAVGENRYDAVFFDEGDKNEDEDEGDPFFPPG